MAINKARVQKLIDAARSGKYTQATGKLRESDNCFCILGLGCEIYRQETEEGEWRDNMFIVRDAKYDFALEDMVDDGEFSDDALPKTVREWYGFDSDNPTVILYGLSFVQKHLIFLNDEEHFSLTQLADILEQNFIKEH